MASALQLKPYEKGIHIRFAPSNEQINEIKNTAKNFALEVLKTIK
jgi:hypothetical protein